MEFLLGYVRYYRLVRFPGIRQCVLRIHFHWAPGYRNIKGNEWTYGLAMQGSAFYIPLVGAAVVWLGVVKDRRESHYLTAAYFIWRMLTTCAMSRRQYPIGSVFGADVCKYVQDYGDLRGILVYTKTYRHTRHTIQRKERKNLQALPKRLPSAS